MKDIKVCNLWISSRKLLFSVYRITEQFPADEKKRVGKRLQEYCIKNLSNVLKCCDENRPDRAALYGNTVDLMGKLNNCLQSANRLQLLRRNDYECLNIQMMEIRNLIDTSNDRREK